MIIIEQNMVLVSRVVTFNWTHHTLYIFNNRYSTVYDNYRTEYDNYYQILSCYQWWWSQCTACVDNLTCFYGHCPAGRCCHNFKMYLSLCLSVLSPFLLWLLITPLDCWWIATQRFGKATLCTMKTDKVRVNVHAHNELTCTHSQFLHCPWTNLAHITIRIPYARICEPL